MNQYFGVGYFDQWIGYASKKLRIEIFDLVLIPALKITKPMEPKIYYVYITSNINMFPYFFF